MKTKTTIILLVIAVIFGAYLYFFEQHQPGTDDLAQLQKRIITLDPKEITKVEIRQENQPYPITVEKTEPDYWKMSSPVSTRAEQALIDDICREVSTLEKKEVITSTNLTVYGLDKPRATALLSTKDKTVLVKVGKDAPMDLGTYIQVAVVPASQAISPTAPLAAPAYVVVKWAVDKISKPLFDFRYKKLFDAGDIYKIQKVLFRYANTNEMEIIRAGDAWSITRPVADKCDKNKVQDLLNALNDARISAFEEDNSTNFAKYGLMPPELMLTISYPNPHGAGLPEQTEILLLGKKTVTDATKYYGMRQGVPTVFTIDTTLANRMMLNPDEMRTKKIFELDKDKLTKISIKHGSRQLAELTADKNAWKFTYPPAAEFAADAVKSFAEKLNDTNIETFVAGSDTNPANFGLAEPFNGLSVSWTADNKETTARFGFGADPKYVYLSLSDSPRIVGLDKSIYEYLRRGSINFRTRNLLNLTPDKVKRITVEQAGAKVIYEQEKLQEWKQLSGTDTAGASPVGIKMENTADINSLRNAMCYLSAIDYAADQPDTVSPFGLDAPQVVVMMESEPAETGKPAIIKVLRVGKKDDKGQYYGMLTDEPVIFYINQSFIESLQKLVKLQ